MQTTANRIPVTIITGFLGAGKTTLLNQLIREYPDKNYAIIENEFGEAGIDSEMVINIDNNNICELANGCICCTLNDDLAELLKDLLNSGKPFDHLLVETTGIADPASVVQTFFSDHEVKSAFKMDSVICLADALHYISAAKEQEEVHRQIAIADIILLNKSSDQTPGVLKEIRESILSLNPHSEIIETSFAEIRGLKLLDRFAYQANRVQAFTLDVFSATRAGEPATTHSITSHSFILPGAFDIEKFSYWMEYFLYINQSVMFRAKGILNFDGNPHKMILQSVRSSYLLEDGDYWDAGEERINRIVFIGKDLNQAEIKEALENLMV
ncbi:MAG TPA: GTP-binding protein [Bacteroides sp.]|nr:GTP-binding protein [Bacteroides sp.]